MRFAMLKINKASANRIPCILGIGEHRNDTRN